MKGEDDDFESRFREQATISEGGQFDIKREKAKSIAILKLAEIRDEHLSE